jgi:putative glutamine amidotransferase
MPFACKKNLTSEPAYTIVRFCMRSDKPKIGITLSETLGVDLKRWPARKPFDYLKQEYSRAVYLSGGIPILLANIDDAAMVGELFDSLDGLLITGGGDMNPLLYGETPHSSVSETTAARDSFELAVIERAITRDRPILAICRGYQVLNVALGGTLYQDLSRFPGKTIVHADPDQTATVFHEVYINPRTKLFGIIGSERIETNSSHHQIVAQLGQGLKISALCMDDQVPEAIERPDSRFVIGVQWHPEAIFDREHSRRLFEAFVKASYH